MAKISTYPVISVPTLNDLLIGTDVENVNETKNFTIGDIGALIVTGNYVPYVGANQDTFLGAFNITANSLINSNGTASDFLKADGSLDSTVYQPAGNYITSLTGEATGSGPGVATVTLSNGAVIGKVLTGLTITGGSVSSTDSILQAFGKLQNQVNSLVGGVVYKGTWNASTNNPLIQSGVGTKGWYYVVNVAGSTNIDGITDWNVGDWIIFDGTAWQQVDNTDTVVSVNGQVGVVVLTTTNIAEGTNLYFTDSRARQAISLTTTGNSGASTYSNLTGILNVPDYTLSGLGGVPSTRELTINGTTYDLSANRSWSVGTVTSVGTSAPLTGGTITSSGTIGITQAGVSSDGYLSSTYWNTFNNKQNALTNPVTGTGTIYYLPMWSGVSALTDSILSYSSNVVTFNYNSVSGGTINYTNTGGTTYTYTIQMNNVGSPRQTYHAYTDGNVLQQINGNVVSQNLQSGQLVLPYYTTTSSFTGTQVGYLGFDASGNILTVSGPSLTGYVPYTGATQDVNLGEWGLTAGQLTLDVSPTGTATVGTTRWNNTIGSSETTLKGGDVLLKNGVDLVARVVNKVTPNTTLTKAGYAAVRVSGAQGQRLAVAYAQADDDPNSADTLGLVCETIPTNQEGFILCVGQLLDVNTTGSLQGETWADGDVLYLSPTTPGALTNIKPNGSTGHIVVMGYVEYAHVNNGKIYVKIMNGWELDELHNVYIDTPLNNEGLFYTSSTQLWENKSIATALGYTPANEATTLTINGTTYDLSANRTWSVGTVTSIGTSGPITGGTITSTGTIGINQATTSTDGYLSSTDWNTFNGKQDAITLTTTGTSGAATLIGSTLNIPQYSGGGSMAIGGSITGATVGSVLFAGTSGVLAQDNASFFWDDTNNRLGIGTATPTADIDITRGVNAAVVHQIKNTTTGTSAQAVMNFIADSNKTAQMQKLSTSFGAPVAPLLAGDFSITNYSSGHMVFANNFSTGRIKFAAGGSTTAQMSLTAAGRLLLGTVTESTFILDANGTGRFTGALTVTAANSTATGGGQIYLNGATANRIDFNSNGVAAPATTTRSTGTKIVLFPGVSATDVDFALGIESSTLWYSVPNASASSFHKWYAGTTNIMSLSGTGTLTLSRNQNAATSISASNTTSGTSSSSQISAISDATSGATSIGKYSTTTTAYKIIAAKDGYLYNGAVAGDIGILNDFTSGTIKFAAGGSSTSQLVLKTTGQLQLNNYTSTSAFTGTAVGFLGFDSSGNILSGTPLGYTIQAFAIATANFTWADNVLYYIGMGPSLALSSNLNINPIYITKAGTIKAAHVVASFSTVGSSENWSAYILINGTTATLIETISVSTSTRDWNNASLSIAVAVGDTVQIRLNSPAWATNPVSNTGYAVNATIYIE